MTPNRETVAINSELVNTLISRKGIKKEWLAATLGISRITLSRWVNGHVKTIKYRHLQKLSECLECSVHQLILKEERGFDLLEKNTKFFNQTNVQNSLALLGDSDLNSKVIDQSMASQVSVVLRSLDIASKLIHLGYLEQAELFYHHGSTIAERLEDKKCIEKACIVNLQLRLIDETPQRLKKFLIRELETQLVHREYFVALQIATIGFWRSIGDFYTAKQEYASCVNQLRERGQEAQEEFVRLEGLLLFAELSYWTGVGRIIAHSSKLLDTMQNPELWKAIGLIWKLRSAGADQVAILVKQLRELNTKHFAIVKFAIECLFISSHISILQEIWPYLSPVKGVGRLQMLEIELMDLYINGARDEIKRERANFVISQVRALGLPKRLPLLKERFSDILV